MIAPTKSSFNWSLAERDAWRPPERIKPSVWAERNRVLPRGQSPRPGPWRNANAPYLRGIMDLPAAQGVSEINIMKAAQVGGSEAIRNTLGCWCATDPEPIGIALPDREKGRKIVGNRIIPMFTGTPCLSVLMGDAAKDTQSSQIKLVNGVILHLMWAGSASSMASDPMCRAVCDEVDKFRDWAGQDADPVSLVRKRLRTYEDRAIQVNISTPTTRYGKICQLFEASTVKLFFFVPCPHCGTFQRMTFPQVKWVKPEAEYDRKALAAEIEKCRSAWYECAHCEKRIDEDDKAVMVAAGRWKTEDGNVQDAEAVGRWPNGTRIGMQISALYCSWVSWSQVAAEFLRSVGDVTALFDFRTGTLGEPFEDQVERVTVDVFAGKCSPGALPEGIIPRWAVRLIATVDTQHDHFYCVVRAWGSEMRSHRVWHGQLETFADLDDLCLTRLWDVEYATFSPMRCDLVLIDSGGTKLKGDEASRTSEVYRWALPRKVKVRPIKGASRPRGGVFIWPGKGFMDDGQSSRKNKQLRVWQLDTHHFNDELQSLILDDDTSRWELNGRCDDDYNAHMSAVHKIAMRRGNQVKETWVPVTAGARHDYRDCEVYQIAAAYMANVHTLPSQAVIDDARESMRQEIEESAKAGVDNAKQSQRFEPSSLGSFI